MKCTNKINQLLILTLFISFLSTSCNTARILDKHVAGQYGQKIEPKKVKSDYITITSPMNAGDGIPSLSVKKTKKLLPFLLYIRVYLQTTCTLNPQIAINNFSGTFTSYANAKRLREKLNNGKLELNIQKVPQVFTFNDDAQFLILVTWERIYLMQQEQSLELTYKVTAADGTETKNGKISIPDKDMIKGVRYFQSLKSATREYLAIYDENIKTMARKAVDEIVREL